MGSVPSFSGSASIERPLVFLDLFPKLSLEPSDSILLDLGFQSTFTHSIVSQTQIAMVWFVERVACQSRLVRFPRRGPRFGDEPISRESRERLESSAGDEIVI